MTGVQTCALPIYLGHSEVVISDTVGFIKHLPTTLIEAFGATLEEATQAD